MVLSGDRFSRSCETDDRHRKTGGSRSWPRKRPAGPEKNGQLSLNELEKKQNKKTQYLFRHYFSRLPSSAYLLVVHLSRPDRRNKKNLHQASEGGSSIECVTAKPTVRFLSRLLMWLGDYIFQHKKRSILAILSFHWSHSVCTEYSLAILNAALRRMHKSGPACHGGEWDWPR